MSVFQRYKTARKELKISQEEIASAIGVTQSALSQQAQRENVPIEALEYIRKAYNVNMNWIFSGEGNMINPPQGSSEVQEWKDKYDALQRDLIKANDELLIIYREKRLVEEENKKLKKGA